MAGLAQARHCGVRVNVIIRGEAITIIRNSIKFEIIPGYHTRAELEFDKRITAVPGIDTISIQP